MANRAVLPPCEITQRRTTRQKDISHFAPWLSRVVLIAVTAVFVGIGVKYIGNPVGTTAVLKITLGSPAAVTSVRVGFGGFSIGFAIFTLICVFSRRLRPAGLYLVLSVVGVAAATRILGIVIDGPAAESLRLLKPELAMLTLAIASLVLESRRPRTVVTRPLVSQNRNVLGLE